MRILADENVDRPIARWLREQGHDVVEASVSATEATDAELIAMSRREARILITFDHDIGCQMCSDSAPHYPGTCNGGFYDQCHEAGHARAASVMGYEGMGWGRL